MKRIILSLVIVLSLALVTFGSAQAITNGVPDGSMHPYVGLLIFTDGSSFWRCSGSALSPTVVLTAGHCTDGAIEAWVTFDTNVVRPSGVTLLDWLNSGAFVPGTAYTEPGFCLGCSNGLVGFDTHDIGVVVLNTPVSLAGYAQLPTLGLVDTLPMGTPIDLVGYGVQDRIVGGGKPVWTGTLTRFYAPSELVASNNRISTQYLKLTANPAQGKGGTCFGDSGGGDFLGGTNIVLGVNSFVTNGNCTGVTYSNRVDLAYALTFIESFLH